MGTSAPLTALTADRVVRRLEWQVLRPLDGRLQGDHRTRLRGQGLDVRDVRRYEPGDDVRHIDWNVTARTDEVHVRQHDEDRDLTAWLLVDHSPSMGFGAPERTKGRLVCEVAATMALLLVRGGNRVGAIVYGDQPTTLPPKQGRDQVLRVVDALLQPHAGTGTVTDLRGLLDLAPRLIRRRSLVVVVSDFICEPGWERSLVRLTERHDVVALRIVDPGETELPDAGLLVVQDAETGEQLLVDASDPALRARLRAAGEERSAAIRDAVRGAGADLQVISTDDDLVAAFVRVLAARRARRTGGRR